MHVAKRDDAHKEAYNFHFDSFLYKTEAFFLPSAQGSDREFNLFSSFIILLGDTFSRRHVHHARWLAGANPRARPDIDASFMSVITEHLHPHWRDNMTCCSCV